MYQTLCKAYEKKTHTNKHVEWKEGKNKETNDTKNIPKSPSGICL